MLIPKYWAETRIEGKSPVRRRVVRRYGWSDESPEAAKAHADARATEAMALVETGASGVGWREPSGHYGEGGIPIREEVVKTFGPEVVTRNGYGALCLNTPDVLFADIDLPAEKCVSPALQTGMGAVIVLAGLAIAGPAAPVAILSALLSAFALGLLYARLKARSLAAADKRKPERKAELLRSIRADLGASSGSRIRIYETPSGFRLGAEHGLFDPGSPEAESFLARVKSDGRFVALCRLQRCFRARVSAKPWRCGFHALNNDAPGNWPFLREDRSVRREQWIAGYGRQAASFAACRYLETQGKGASHPRAVEVLDLHDELCRARSSLPIA